VNTFSLLFLDDASEFIDSLPDKLKAKVLAALKTMETDFNLVYTKTLRGRIKELVVQRYRIVFFIKGSIIYVVLGFIKKSQKTPVQEIENAERIYKMV
jgi:phage-related protein